MKIKSDFFYFLVTLDKLFRSPCFLRLTPCFYLCIFVVKQFFVSLIKKSMHFKFYIYYLFGWCLFDPNIININTYFFRIIISFINTHDFVTLSVLWECYPGHASASWINDPMNICFNGCHIKKCLKFALCLWNRCFDYGTWIQICFFVNLCCLFSKIKYSLCVLGVLVCKIFLDLVYACWLLNLARRPRTIVFRSNIWHSNILGFMEALCPAAKSIWCVISALFQKIPI